MCMIFKDLIEKFRGRFDLMWNEFIVGKGV